jgi:polyhydroxyalkanoate synthesis regulator phasin
MDNKRIKELEKQIADLERQWPAHSVPPAMLQRLDELEEELEILREEMEAGEKDAEENCTD